MPVYQVPPPERLIPDLQASIGRAMRDVPPGKNAIVVDVDRLGGNLAIVHKSENGDLMIEGWIAKKWSDRIERVEGGARVVKTW